MPATTPTKPGFYWALWLSAANGDDFAAAVERLRRHFAARTDGDCPYRRPNEHDPETAFQWDADLYRMDSEAVIRRYLEDHPPRTN